MFIMIKVVLVCIIDYFQFATIQVFIIILPMDDKNFQLAEQLVHASYIRLGQNSINKRQKMMKELLSQRQLPTQPMDQLTIRYILDSLALMDSNNFDNKVGVGQRQSRIFSRLVEERHFHMGHGIGRSGDIMANQPKAAGSSLLLQLTRYLTISALHQLNYEFVKDLLLLPLATGMALTLAFLTLAQQAPTKKYVIWSRIDQKTCLKSIISANLIPVVVQLKPLGDYLCTNTQQIVSKLNELKPQNVLAIVSTTSCFAPRVPDNVEELSLIAKKFGVFHVVNNAYGVWCSKIANGLKEGTKNGQCTVVVQSTDKNFMVPVGGSFIFCSNPSILQKISGKYPGRANGSPIVDMFITLLSMGKSTIKQLKKERKANFQQMKKLATVFANKHKCKLLESPSNTISIGMHLDFPNFQSEQLTKLGSILYSKRVMGHRIIVSAENKTTIGPFKFTNYGSHSDNYAFLPYMTFACAVGTKKQELIIFFQRLQEGVKQLLKKQNKKHSVLSKQTNESDKLDLKIEIAHNPVIEQLEKDEEISI